MSHELRSFVSKQAPCRFSIYAAVSPTGVDMSTQLPLQWRSIVREDTRSHSTTLPGTTLYWTLPSCVFSSPPPASSSPSSPVAWPSGPADLSTTTSPLLHTLASLHLRPCRQKREEDGGGGKKEEGGPTSLPLYTTALQSGLREENTNFPRYTSLPDPT